jgi:Holliday junction resolvasome RuvABC endonuclease subunit
LITLGLDPSLTGFGWCVHRSDVVGSGRVVAKGTFRTPSKRVFIWRYMFMRSAVSQLLCKFPQVEAVGVESPPFGELWSEGLYGLFLYVNEALFTRRMDVVYFDPARVKLLAKMDPSIRRGTMEKRDMVEASKADTGIKRWNHNEADAFIIARSTARFWEFLNGLLGEEELTPSERQVFARTHTIVRGPRAGRTIKSGLAFKEDDRYFRFSSLNLEDTVVTVDLDSPEEV